MITHHLKGLSLIFQNNIKVTLLDQRYLTFPTFFPTLCISFRMTTASHFLQCKCVCFPSAGVSQLFPSTSPPSQPETFIVTTWTVCDGLGSWPSPSHVRIVSCCGSLQRKRQTFRSLLFYIGE